MGGLKLHQPLNLVCFFLIVALLLLLLLHLFLKKQVNLITCFLLSMLCFLQISYSWFKPATV